MGYVTYRRPDGTSADFIIAGDAPTPDEQARIDANLSGKTLPSSSPDTGPGVISSGIAGLMQGVNQYQANLYETGAGIAHALGSKSWEDWALEQANKQAQEAGQYTVGEKGAPYVAGLLAQQAPQMAGGWGGMIGGGALGGAIGGPPGAVIGSVVGGLAGIYPTMLGQHVEEQQKVNNGQVKDWGKAAGWAAPATASEFAGNLIELAVAGVASKVPMAKPLQAAITKALVGGPVRKALTRVALSSAAGATTEPIEEVIQQAIQRAQADESLTSDEAKAQYVQAAVQAAIVGGVYGVGAGTVGHVIDTREENRINDVIKNVEDKARKVQQMYQTADETDQQFYDEMMKKEQDAFIKQKLEQAPQLPAPRGDQTVDQAVWGKQSKPLTDNTVFTEEERNRALEAVRGEKKFSPDKIRRMANLGRKNAKNDAKALAIFNSLLERGDAQKAGKYATINSNEVNREYKVGPVPDTQAEPYLLQTKDRTLTKRFSTEQEAQKFADEQGLKGFEITKDVSEKHGVYSVTTHKGGAKNGEVISTQLVHAYDTPQQAIEAARGFDPKFSPETNQIISAGEHEGIRQKVLGELQKKRQGDTAELSNAINEFAKTLLGEHAVKVQITPNLAGPAAQSLAEGRTAQIRDEKTQNGFSHLVQIADAVARGNPNEAMGTMTHEAVHVLRDLGLFTPQEWSALKSLANQKVPGQRFTWMDRAQALNAQNPTANIHEEAVAEMTRAYREKPDSFTKQHRNILQKIFDFIKRLVGVEKNNPLALKTMQDILSGQIGQREAGSKAAMRDRLGPVWSQVPIKPFYLQTDKAIERVPQETMTPKQWLGFLKNQQQIKPEERQWLGLEQWLETLQEEGGGQVDKAELQKFIRANSLAIIPQEKIYGGMSSEDYNRHAVLDEHLSTAYYEDTNAHDLSFEAWINDQINNNKKYANEAQELRQLEFDALREPFHESTTQEGGDQYKEFVFTLPQLLDGFAVSGHFGGKRNIVVSARTKVRDYADGKKILFIEEIQSDVHQRGRRYGYEGEDVQPRIDKLRKKIDEVRAQYSVKDNEMRAAAKTPGPDYSRLRNERDALDREINRLEMQRHDLESAYKIPQAPFKTTWDQFAFKKLVQHAAEQGLDGVAWHGNEESVALTEGYPDPYAEEYSGIMDFYTRRLGSWAKKFFKKYGAEIQYIDPTEGQGLTYDNIAQDMAALGPIDPAFFTEAANNTRNEDMQVRLRAAANILSNQRPTQSYQDIKYQDISDAAHVAGLSQPMWQYMWNEYEAGRSTLNDIFKHGAETASSEDERHIYLEGDKQLSQIRTWYERYSTEQVIDALKKADITAPEFDLLMRQQMDIPIEGDANHNPLVPRFQMNMTDELKTTALHEAFPVFSAMPSPKALENLHARLKEDSNFKHWFGLSKVVDQNGEPAVMYHSTRKILVRGQQRHEFPEFNHFSHFGTIQAAHDRLAFAGMADFLEQDKYRLYHIATKEGVFTPEEMAEIESGRKYDIYGNNYEDELKDWWTMLDNDTRYALMNIESDNWFDGARLYPMFMSIRNPLRIEDDGRNHTLDDLILFTQAGGAFGDNTRMFLTNIRNPEVKAAELTKAMKRAGYDGWVYENTIESPGEDSFIPLEKWQAKSIYNRGSWSKLDPRYDWSSVPAPDGSNPQWAATAPLGERVNDHMSRERWEQMLQAATYNNLAPTLKKLNTILPDKYKHRFDRLVDSGIYNLQDRMVGVAELIDMVRKEGGTVTNDNDTFLKERLFPGQTDAELQDRQKDLYTPFIDRIHSLGISSQTLNELAALNQSAEDIINNYAEITDEATGERAQGRNLAMAELILYALHAQERNAEMRLRNERVADVRTDQYNAGSGMSDDHAEAILNYVFGRPDLAAKLTDLRNENSIRSMFRRLIANTNARRVAGQISPDFTQIETRANYQDYAPLKGWLEEHFNEDEDANIFARTGKGYSIRGKEDMSALGRRRLASHIISNAILQNEEAIIRAKKNEVGRSFLQFIRDNPDLTLGAAQIIETRPVKWGLDSRTGSVRRMTDLGFQNRKDILTVKEMGEDGNIKETYIQFSDPRVAEALTVKSSLGNAGLGVVMKTFLKVNHFLGQLSTSFNPEFWLSNFPRDFQTAMLNLSEQGIEGIRGRVAKDTLPSLYSIFRYTRDNSYTDSWTDTFLEFRRRGGMSAFMGLRDINDTMKTVERLATEDPSKMKDFGRKLFRSTGQLVEDINLAIENGVRLASYKAMRDAYIEMGATPQEAMDRAAYGAKELTINFNAGGNQKPFWNSMYLFFNASMQGSMALINPLIRSKKMRRMWGTIMLAGVMQDLLMSTLMPDEYDDMKDWILEHNIILPNIFDPNGKSYIKIPLPYLMNAVYNSGRAMSRAARGKYNAGETFNTIAGSYLDALNPWGTGGNAFINFLAPTIADPIVDLTYGKNFTGAPISPEGAAYGPKVKDSQLYWNNTNPLAISVADWMSRLSGSQGTYLPGLVEVSPNSIEYLVDYATGGAGTFVRRLWDFMPFVPMSQNIVQEWVKTGDISANDVPMVRRYIGNMSSRNDLERYITKRDKVMAVRQELRLAAMSGDSQHYLNVMAEHPVEYRLTQQVNSIESERRKISRQIKSIQRNKSIPEAEKSRIILMLKERQNQLVGLGLEVMGGT